MTLDQLKKYVAEKTRHSNRKKMVDK